jgi:hypothetical protein
LGKGPKAVAAGPLPDDLPDEKESGVQQNSSII